MSSAHEREKLYPIQGLEPGPLALCVSVLTTYSRFLERKICNPLVNVADRLKKLKGSEQIYLVNVKTVLM